MTTSFGPALTVMPFVPAIDMPPSPEPSEAIVIALVTVTAPKPPGSSVSISPPAAVLEIAPGKVLQGAVREHGLTSSPTPEIQVRVACADAAFGAKNMAAHANAKIVPLTLITFSSVRGRPPPVGGFAHE